MRTGAIIYPILAGDTDLTTLVPSTKIFAVRALQQTTAPYIVYREISCVPTNTTGPDATADTSDPRASQRSILDVCTVQISCFAEDYLAVENIAYQVRKTLDREWGTVDAPYNTEVYLDGCIFESCIDDYDDDFGDRGIYIKHLDFRLRIRRII
tara:strand:- start:172 stop:633 length:462 start_codon:yes stop_codon:yes gene_type:complete